MLPLSILSIAQVCSQLGVRRMVLSPGSRSAPLTLAFVRHPNITTHVISDERSAAFIGLGLAQRLRQPVGLVCTSGSAAYNYAPAVAEAFFQQVPLIVFTADRPPEWIDQLDGQTIRQRAIYGSHVKASYELPVGKTEADEWYAGRIVSEAILLSQQYPPGPVHINVPIREPFYPRSGDVVKFNEDMKVITSMPGRLSLPDEALETLATEWNEYERKLIVGGQGEWDASLTEALSLMSTIQQVPVIADVISNLHPVASPVQHADVLLAQSSKVLAPDLLVTFGRSVISKHLKLFLRKHRPKEHWHIQPAGTAADTFQSLTRVVHVDPVSFFRLIAPKLPLPASSQKNYFQQWESEETKAQQRLDQFYSQLSDAPPGEFRMIREVLRQMPDATDLHLANSMTVRYANLIGLHGHHGAVEVFANRGTSGIDGSSSTAVGSALASGRLTVLITGDMAFFYDRNAFWHNYLLPNLRIVLLNNHAGGIFRLIDGPNRQPELEEYFETKQPLTAERTAQDFNLEYHQIDLTESGTYSLLESYLDDFYGRNGDHAKLLEITTNSQTNHEVFEQYRRIINPTE